MGLCKGHLYILLQRGACYEVKVLSRDVMAGDSYWVGMQGMIHFELLRHDVENDEVG